jgi:hypothetical protein
MKNANYRKFNDRSLNCSKYHKLDGTSVRAMLKREAEKEVDDLENDLTELVNIVQRLKKDKK